MFGLLVCKLRIVEGARLLAFALAVLVGSSLWLAHAARARVDELFDDLDRQVMRYANPRHVGETHTVNLNGLRLRLTSGTTADSLGQVLDFYQARCRAHDELLGAKAVLRDESEHRGHVACFDPGESPTSAKPLSDRLRAFARDLDASALGTFRYVSAETARHGTAYLSIVSQGSMPLASAFPNDAEAPGADPADIPRPERVTRALALTFEDRVGSIHIYRSSDRDVDSQADRYREALLRSGFKIIASQPMGPVSASNAPRVLSVSKGEAVYTVSTSADARGFGIISILRAP